MEPSEPKPLPRSLAAEGKADPVAAANEQIYTESLPEHYRQKWEQEGISPRAAEAEQQARTSLRARVSLRPEKHVEAAVRKECGADAQRLDKEMREDMEQHRPRLAVLSRIDTLQSEEWRGIGGAVHAGVSGTGAYPRAEERAGAGAGAGAESGGNEPVSCSRRHTGADCGPGGANGDEAGKRRDLLGARIAMQRRVLRLMGDWRP